MRASNTVDGLGVAPGGAIWAALVAMTQGALGFTVRCTPRRRTVFADLPGVGLVFGKIRQGRIRDAKAEWRWLHRLPELGLAVPWPVGFWRQGQVSVLATAAVHGQPLDALLRAALGGGQAPRAVAFACRVVAPKVAQLHRAGLVFRDL